MGGERRQVGSKDRPGVCRADRWSGQLAERPAGNVLFVGVVLLEQGQPLQLGVGLGERQDGRVARRDRFDLGVGKLLAADVLGTAGGVVTRHNLRNEPGLGLQRLIG